MDPNTAPYLSRWPESYFMLWARRGAVTRAEIVRCSKVSLAYGGKFTRDSDILLRNAPSMRCVCAKSQWHDLVKKSSLALELSTKMSNGQNFTLVSNLKRLLVFWLPLGSTFLLIKIALLNSLHCKRRASRKSSRSVKREILH